LRRSKAATLLKVWDTETGRVLATEAVNAHAVGVMG